MGEPGTITLDSGGDTVYPRVYGGTFAFMPRPLQYAGLSPRVRGNLNRQPMRLDNQRSIPACTGEPILTWTSCFLSGVYPRVYGGTCFAFFPVQHE